MLQDIQVVCGIITTICTVAWIVNQWMFYSVINKQINKYNGLVAQRESSGLLIRSAQVQSLPSPNDVP